MRWIGILLLFFAATLANAGGEKPFVPNNRWAVVIGVSKYSDEIGQLKYTAKEARQFASALTDTLQFDQDKVKLLADEGKPEEAPTAEHILGTLDKVLADKRLDKGNLFIFYFSGHGVATPKGDFLLPSDTKKDQIEQMGVPVRDVVARIVKAGLKNVLFIADACRSGTANDFGEEFTNLCHEANLAVILGCAPGKRSYEFREFKQGAFTHFLLSDLAKPEARDVSGTIWASKLGRMVQQEVHDYTEPEFGEFAQKPYLWGEQSTLDVLLATYPQPPVSDTAIKAFQDTASKLDKPTYAAALVAYASQLLIEDREDKAVEFLKTASQLGELDTQGRYLLASSLDFLGRKGEAERMFQELIKQADGYYSDIALLSSPSKSLPPKQRIAAAERFLKTDRTWNERLLAASVVDLWGQYEDKLKAAKLLAAGEDPPRQHLYALAKVADLEGRWAESDRLLQQAAKEPGDDPSPTLLFLGRVHTVSSSGDLAALGTLMDEGIKIPDFAGFCWLKKAAIAKEKGNLPERLADLTEALKSPLDPEQLWLSVKLAGPYLTPLVPALKTQAEAHPYSWRAQITMAFACQIQGDTEGAKQAALAADRYIDDPLNFKSVLADLMYSFMMEAVQANTLAEQALRNQLDFSFLSLLDDVGKFGYDAELWSQITTYGLFNERTAQVTQLLAKHLPMKLEDSPRDLRPILLLAALNRGDAAAVAKLSKTSYGPNEGTDASFFLALYAATQERFADADTLLKSAPRPSATFQGVADALRTLLLVRSGKKEEARARLKAPSDDITVQGLQGLAWAALGDWKRAEPLLAQQENRRNWTFLFVHAYALRVLDDHYRSNKNLKGSQEIAHSVLISQPWNPLFTRFSFVASPGVAQFKGKVRLKGLAVSDRLDNSDGTLEFSVDGAGKLRGAFVDTNGRQVFSGQVDAYGNVTGTGRWLGKLYNLSGKIAPPALYKSFVPFKTKGQVLQLIDGEGYRIALLGRS